MKVFCKMLHLVIIAIKYPRYWRFVKGIHRWLADFTHSNMWDMRQHGACMGEIWGSMTSAWWEIWGSMTSAWWEIWGTMTSAWDEIWGTMTSVWDEILGNITSAWWEIWGTMTSAWGEIWGTMAVDRYLRRIGDKAIPDEGPPSL